MSETHLPQPVGRQREVLYLPPSGHTVVLGTAGSGKTTLAILRSLFLSDPTTDHGGRTLLVTFNRCLVTYMRHLAGALRHPVVVENYHRFARGYLSVRNRLQQSGIASPEDRLVFIRLALNDTGRGTSLTRRPEEFFDEEFQWIQNHGVSNESAYVAASRVGRANTRVRRSERAHLFELYRRYLAHRQSAGKLYDWSDLATAVREELGADEQSRRYRHVVVDEGQDFSPEMLRSLAACIPRSGSLTFFGDIAQQIYGHKMSWRNAGLDASRVWEFRENYRNTKQISRLALALAAMRQFPTDPDLVEPRAPVADGPLPALVRNDDEQQELDLVTSQAASLARAGTVAILFRTREDEDRLAASFRRGATRLHRNLRRWPTTPGAFYGTYHAAKGLEFDSVFLPFLSEDRWPPSSDVDSLGPEEAIARNMRLLYVGCTRARSTLVLTHSGEITRLLPLVEGLYQR